MQEIYGSIKILVVDDEEMLRSSIDKYLKRKGFQTFQAGSGKEAIEFLKTTPVNLIVSDMRMANGGGDYILDEVQAMGNKPKVIIVTGFSEIENADLLKRGAAIVMPKPLEREELLNHVIHLLGLPKDE